MAVSVRIEDEAFSDARIDRMGEVAGYNRYEALGRMAHLWRLCTQRQQYVVSESMVVACLGANGVAAVLESELAERVEDGIRVRGTAGRIEWLEKKRAAAKKGGEANRSRHEAKREPNGYPNASHDRATEEPNGSLTGAYEEPRPSPPAPAPAPAPAKAEKEESARSAHPSPRKSKSDPTPAERADVERVVAGLNQLAGTRFKPDTHEPLILARLREGKTADDLEAIARYCAVKLGWKSDAKMADYLRPPTLYGPQSITKYIDQAREYAAKHPRPPMLVLVAPMSQPVPVAIETDWYAPPPPIGGFHDEEEAS